MVWSIRRPCTMLPSAPPSVIANAVHITGACQFRLLFIDSSSEPRRGVDHNYHFLWIHFHEYISVLTTTATHNTHTHTHLVECCFLTVNQWPDKSEAIFAVHLLGRCSCLQAPFKHAGQLQEVERQRTDVGGITLHYSQRTFVDFLATTCSDSLASCPAITLKSCTGFHRQSLHKCSCPPLFLPSTMLNVKGLGNVYKTK